MLLAAVTQVPRCPAPAITEPVKLNEIDTQVPWLRLGWVLSVFYPTPPHSKSTLWWLRFSPVQGTTVMYNGARPVYHFAWNERSPHTEYPSCYVMVQTQSLSHLLTNASREKEACFLLTETAAASKCAT